jgi:hypothetical protein
MKRIAGSRAVLMSDHLQYRGFSKREQRQTVHGTQALSVGLQAVPGSLHMEIFVTPLEGCWCEVEKAVGARWILPLGFG